MVTDCGPVSAASMVADESAMSANLQTWEFATQADRGKFQRWRAKTGTVLYCAGDLRAKSPANRPRAAVFLLLAQQRHARRVGRPRRNRVGRRERERGAVGAAVSRVVNENAGQRNAVVVVGADFHDRAAVRQVLRHDLVGLAGNAGREFAQRSVRSRVRRGVTTTN